MPTDPSLIPSPQAAAAPAGAARVSESATVDQTPAEAGLDEQVAFWHSAAGRNLLPLLTSIAIHLAVVLGVAVTFTGLGDRLERRVEQVVIPDSTIIEGVDAVALTNPGLGDDPSRAAAQDQFRDVPAGSRGWSDRPTRAIDLSVLESVSSRSGAESLIGIGGGPGRSGIGSNDSDGPIVGGPLAPFGVPGGGQGVGPRSVFMGVSATAMKVAFVCDASGSMMNKFDALRLELQKAVGALKPVQQFSIVFFQEQNAAVIDERLIFATEPNKQRAYTFLNNARAHGSTDVIPALRAAFDQNPELIYLLTDGDFHGRNQQVVEFIRNRNGEKKVRINTIAFVNSDEEYRKVLEQIAKENGGNFKFVSDEDLR
jgi:hypothetical protein